MLKRRGYINSLNEAYWLTSILKARSPCLPSLRSNLIAAKVPSLRTPLYIKPCPPLPPITFLSLNPSVAISSSLYVNTWTPRNVDAGVLLKFPPWRHPLFTSTINVSKHLWISFWILKPHPSKTSWINVKNNYWINDTQETNLYDHLQSGKLCSCNC